MGHTIIGIFHHSGDADLAAAHLREAFTLEADELDMIGQAEWDQLSVPAADPTEAWAIASLTGIGLHSAPGEEEPIGKRWGDQVWRGQTLVVARTYDPEVAQAIARELHEAGAQAVDLLPH